MFRHLDIGPLVGEDWFHTADSPVLEKLVNNVGTLQIGI